MGRRSIWSRQEIIDLSKQFVPATDEVWRLQNGDDPECLHFQAFADTGHYRRHQSTRQGTYVCTPSGVLLGSMNTHNADRVAAMLKDCLKKYSEMDRSERLLADASAILPKHRWEQSYQKDGLNLSMYARDLPQSCNPDDDADRNWNQDRVWFSSDEARQFLPSDLSRIYAGQTWSLSDKLVNRLARFSVIDTVKGQTSFFDISQVTGSQISAKVESQNESEIRISLRGETKAHSGSSRGRTFPHGIATTLLGAATFDRATNKFTHFEIVALGNRYGRTVFNGRARQLEESPVGFVFRLTPPEAPLIAPAALYAYQADWVKHPQDD